MKFNSAVVPNSQEAFWTDRGQTNLLSMLFGDTSAGTPFRSETSPKVQSLRNGSPQAQQPFPTNGAGLKNDR